MSTPPSPAASEARANAASKPSVTKWNVAPPAAPIVLPGAANRPEHVPTHHVGTAQAQQQVACPRIGVIQRLVEMPAMKLHPAAAKRVLEVLVRSCDVAVERDRHVACGGCFHTC